MNRRKNAVNKFLITLMNIRKTAYHHYGNNFLSVPKFIYYSLFVINTFIIFEIRLKREIGLQWVPVDPEFRVIKPSIGELSEIRRNKNLPREFYYDEIHGVKRCYIALNGDEIAYIHWVYVKGDYNRFLVLADGVAELNYNTTLPKFRGRRLMAKMMGYILRDLKAEGFTRVVGVVNAKNPPALKAMRRAGFSEIGKIRTVGPFSKKVEV